MSLFDREILTLFFLINFLVGLMHTTDFLAKVIWTAYKNWKKDEP